MRMTKTFHKLWQVKFHQVLRKTIHGLLQLKFRRSTEMFLRKDDGVDTVQQDCGWC